MEFDLVIRGGTIVDGTRFPRYVADIGVKDGRIGRIGRIPAGEARREIDAAGKIVAPGHIDLHTHYDAQIHWDPYCTNSGDNGVTTVVAGNCGFGFAPCRPDDRERYMLMMENTEQVPYLQMKMALPWTWESFPEWLDHLRALKKGVNMMMFMPLNPLMIYVMGIEAAKTRAARPDEIAQMKKLIHEAMDAGACGIAFSHLGTHNSHTDYDGSPMPTDTMSKDDAVALASVLAERSEGLIQTLSQLGLVNDPDLVERIAQASGRPVIQNVFVTHDVMTEFHLPQVAWLTAVNERGATVFGQTFAQRGWSEFNLIDLNINDHIAEWRALSMIKSLDEKLERLRDPEMRRAMREAYDPFILSFGSGPLEVIVVSNVDGVAAAAGYVDRTIGEIAAEEGKHVLDTMFDIAIMTGGKADFRTPSPVGTDPHRTAALLAHPHILAGTSDGGAHSKFFSGGHWPTELLIWLVREAKTFTLEDMHYRLSYQPARVLGLTDRGEIAAGKAADLIIYDLENLRMGDARYEIRHDLPGGDWRRYMPTQGYDFILVNGAITWEAGACTGATSGDFLTVTTPQARITPTAPA